MSSFVAPLLSNYSPLIHSDVLPPPELNMLPRFLPPFAPLPPQQNWPVENVAGPSNVLPAQGTPDTGEPMAKRSKVIEAAGRSEENVAMDLSQPIKGAQEEASTSKENSSDDAKAEQRPTSSVPITGQMVTHDVLLGRWRLLLEIFGRLFFEDVGAEPGSIINEMGGFPVKEIRFRKKMEKLRSSYQRDINLEVDRNRTSLIVQTFKAFNLHFQRRTYVSGPTLGVNRIKVTFKNEPGEGSGVTRSFFTAFADSILKNEPLPNLESCAVVSGNKPSFSQTLMNRFRRLERREYPWRRSRSDSRTSSSGDGLPEFRVLSFEEEPTIVEHDVSAYSGFSPRAPPFKPSESSFSNLSMTEFIAKVEQHIDFEVDRNVLGNFLHRRVAEMHPRLADDITGTMLDLPLSTIINMLTSDTALCANILQALSFLRLTSAPGDPRAPFSTPERIRETLSRGAGSLSSGSLAEQLSERSPKPVKYESCVELNTCVDDDSSPLFWQPGRPGFYSPRPGKNAQERLNAFRNVGRVIGMCLLFLEICPIPLCRHVLKYILNRPIYWHDFAFFDPQMYESLRSLLMDAEKPDAEEHFKGIDITFEIELTAEEGGGLVNLVPDGRNVSVTPANVYNYVYLYTKYRMVKVIASCLEFIRMGVFDVLSQNSLAGLTAEDLRLILNGVPEVDVNHLASYTSFNDESGETTDKIAQFKKWFWSVIEHMSPLEKQDFLFFWTGSPCLPSSEEGFMPLPTVTLRPSDDAHLPTANTCISRLYVPVYTSRVVLKMKLLLAIKTKCFGFV